jgi:enoyl-CoA hydratase
MPETAIGFFPDVGGSFFLPRLRGELGTYLALTGARLTAADLVHTGIATHFVSAEKLSGIVERLSAGEPVDDVVAESAGTPRDATVVQFESAVDRAFAHDNMAAILNALAQEGEWGRKTADTIRAKSPIALMVTLREMREGRKLGFDDCMRMEYRLALRSVASHDFREGVRAVVIDKDRSPKWDPPALDLVREADVDAYFAPLGAQELSL